MILALIVYIALIIYALYMTKYLPSQGIKTGLIIGMFFPSIGVGIGFICDLVTAYRAVEWFPIFSIFGGMCGLGIGVIITFVLSIIIIIWANICKHRSQS